MPRSECKATAESIWPGYVKRPKRIRLLLIDDQPMVHKGIPSLLSLASDVTVIQSVGDLEIGIKLVLLHQPDLVVCDLSLPSFSGGSAVRELCSRCPSARVLVLTSRASLECIREAFNAGAIGFVRKDASCADLLTAVRHAADGSHGMCSGVIDTVMRNWLTACVPPSAAEAALSPTDRQMLRLIALGVPTWRIAGELTRGVKAVEKYRATLMRRLDLRSIAAVTRYALRCNLLTPDELNQRAAENSL